MASLATASPMKIHATGRTAVCYRRGSTLKSASQKLGYSRSIFSNVRRRHKYTVMAESTENVDESEEVSDDGDEVDLDELQKVFDEIQDELVSSQEESLRHYEICYLVSSALTDDKVAELIEKYKSFIESSGGKIHRLEDWGRRRLAYRINDRIEANYVLINFESFPSHLHELTSAMDNDEAIARKMVFKRKEAITGPSPMMGGIE